MYKCQYCNKEFNSIQGLSGHKSHCKLNPNYNDEKIKNNQIKASLSAAKKKKEKYLKEQQEDEKTRKDRILICSNCGKEYILNLTDKEFNKGKYKKCCSDFCSHSHKHSEETKNKIKEIRKNAILNKTYIPSNCKLLSDLLKDDEYNKYCLNLDNYEYKEKYVNLKSLQLHTCSNCGKEFYGRITKFGNFVKTKQCCDKCQTEFNRKISKENVQKRIENGTFKGWQSRNILSYPEKFWTKVLENNKIEFISNKPVKQENNMSCYFLDFYIEKNGRKIDLEIDGKQHKYKDRQESDKKRDIYLKSLGYEVYRIEWNAINKKSGKDLMKEKIDKFIKYYNGITN